MGWGAESVGKRFERIEPFYEILRETTMPRRWMGVTVVALRCVLPR